MKSFRRVLKVISAPPYMDIITQENINEFIWNTSVKVFDKINKAEVFIVTDYKIRRKGVGSGIRGTQQDEKTQELYRQQSAIRAGSRIRELVLANNLKYMWTLTYSDEITDAEQVKIDFNNFKRNLNHRTGKNINYVAVIEIQEERSQKAGKDILHLHFATDKRIDIKKVNEAWKKGFVFVSEYSGDIGKVSGYLSKYIKKGIDSTAIRDKEQKRYMTSKGLAKPLRITLVTSQEDYLKFLPIATAVKEFEEGIWLQVNKDELLNSLDGNKAIEIIGKKLKKEAKSITASG